MEVDERSERMNAKIRDAQKQKIPYMLVVGDPRRKAGRWLCACATVKTRGACPWDFVAKAKKDIEAGD